MLAKDALAANTALGVPPESCTQDGFREAVLEVVARAKAALPDAEGRIDTAAALVLAGEVELRVEERTARVVSRTVGGPDYVVHGQCQCDEVPTAPGHLCTHRLAYGIAKRAMGLAQERLATLTTPTGQGAGAPPDALAVAPGDTAEGDRRDLGPPLEPITPASLPHVTDLPAQYLHMIDGMPSVKYAGLLALAHAQGLQQLEARFTEVSDTLAVAQATATFTDGRRFTESGEATPENVGSQVRPHFARLALTRAKARCLRDALNIALCAVEEGGG
jgi:hypothetical protein